MAHPPRCTKCGNPIPTWAATCPVCANMAIAAKKFGGKTIKPFWQQKTSPIKFKAPALPPGVKTGHAPQNPKPDDGMRVEDRSWLIDRRHQRQSSAFRSQMEKLDDQ